MPDPGWLTALAVLVMAGGLVVLRPILRTASAEAAVEGGDDLSPLAVRHRIAVESLRDVEADHRAGTLDEASYLGLREEAEARAAETLAELEVARAARSDVKRLPGAARSPEVAQLQAHRWPARRIALLLATALGILLAIGAVLPPPVSLGNGTVIDQQLAAAQVAEKDRQQQIQVLLAQLRARPNDPPALIRLANLYLTGGTVSDTATAANLLLAAIRLDPKSADAYRLLITAYISTGDYRDATAATNAFAKLGAGVATDVAFFRGLIAYQGSGDRAAAIRWFETFLNAAPNDPRAAMIRSLRAEAMGQLPGGSASASPAP